jgi:phosphohistidine swiveling domain-containing protein
MGKTKLEKHFTRDFCLATTEWWRTVLDDRFVSSIGVGYHDYIAVSDGICLQYFATVDDECIFRSTVLALARKRPTVLMGIFSTFLREAAITRRFLDQLPDRRALTSDELTTLLERLRLLFPGLRLALRIPAPWAEEIRQTPRGSELIALTLRARKATDGLYERIDLALRNQAARFLEHTQQPARDAKFVRLFELVQFTAGVPVSAAQVRQRRRGFVFVNGDVIPTRDGLAELAKRGYILPKEQRARGTLTGQVAFRHRPVIGRVKIINAIEQLRSFKSGEILVSAMTIPPFLPAMRMAKAIVTDEGGITCHAAIVARELKKPCIIGTKIATKILKDGDQVEVDAVKGTVKLLEKK